MHVQVSPSDTIPVASLDSMPEATRKRMLTTEDTWFRTVSKVEEPEARQKAIDLGACTRLPFTRYFFWCIPAISIRGGIAFFVAA